MGPTMSRLPRFHAPGQPLHALQRGNNRDPIFAADADYAFFRVCLLDAATLHEVAIHAYVFMTNHVHLLASPASADGLSKLFQSVGRRYVQYFNHSHRRSGTLWEGRYRATVVHAEDYLLTCMRYIEMNPQRARMVERAGDYPHSSYRANAQGETDELVTPHRIYRRIASDDAARLAAYRQLFRAPIGSGDLESIRAATQKGWVLGNHRFRERIEALTGRRAAPLPKGRPRKVG
jgi:putative transposase